MRHLWCPCAKALLVVAIESSFVGEADGGRGVRRCMNEKNKVKANWLWMVIKPKSQPCLGTELPIIAQVCPTTPKKLDKHINSTYWKLFPRYRVPLTTIDCTKQSIKLFNLVASKERIFKNIFYILFVIMTLNWPSKVKHVSKSMYNITERYWQPANLSPGQATLHRKHCTYLSGLRDRAEKFVQRTIMEHALYCTQVWNVPFHAMCMAIYIIKKSISKYLWEIKLLRFVQQVLFCIY